MIDFLIVDNFYIDPIAVRDFALTQNFDVVGNYPGKRTQSCSEPFFSNIKQYIESNIIKTPITYWPTEYNTSFQITTEESKTWIHHDCTRWAGVIYLTPNAPIESGTGIYRHKESKIFLHQSNSPIDYNEAAIIEKDWELIAFCGNIFNRLVIYNGMLYHRSVLPGFGTCKQTGRLFQTFFFDA
jgi:hypothetical protein